VTRAWRYSRWDGSQKVAALDADALLGDLADDLLYHGDLNAALRRLMQSGLRTPDGERMAGLREMMQRLRSAKRQRLEDADLGGPFAEMAKELREIVDQERRALDDMVERARQSGDQRRLDNADSTATEHHLDLDMLPPDLAGQMRTLDSYDFVSPEAEQRYRELSEQLRQEMADQFFRQVTGAMSNPDPEQMAAMKDMLADLNQMLDDRANGREPDFEGFMARHGQFFPENPQTLDELLEALARRMAAAQAMLNSMSAEQRAQLHQLSQQFLDADMDLRWQMDQLGSNLRQMFPEAGWDRSYQGHGRDPLGFAQAMDLMEELGDLDALEQLLESAAGDPRLLDEVDLDRVRDLLGGDAAHQLDQLSRLAEALREAGYIDEHEGRVELTPRGLRRLGQHALKDLFQHLTAGRAGRHEAAFAGAGHEREYSTKPYEWGDPFNLHIERTLRNAVRRTGSGTPVRITPDDFEIERTEVLTRSATVLCLDLSLSMPMQGNWLPAKKLAMALSTLVKMQYPRDFFGMVGFGFVARPLAYETLPEVSWDFAYGTNIQHALQLARRQLDHEHGHKQILLVTDGEPTAHTPSGGVEPIFHYPPLPETLDETMREVIRTTRAGITINTFALMGEGGGMWFQPFVEQMAEVNKGRAFFCSPERLGDYVMVDFLEHKRKLHRGGRGRSATRL